LGAVFYEEAIFQTSCQPNAELGHDSIIFIPLKLRCSFAMFGQTMLRACCSKDVTITTTKAKFACKCPLIAGDNCHNRRTFMQANKMHPLLVRMRSLQICV
jgi:hypothetical protein